MIPLPIPHNDKKTYSFIESGFKYLIVSTNKLNYAQLKDLSNCIKVNQTEYICENYVKYITLNNPTCEISLLIEVNSKIPNDCKTKILAGYIEIWQNLVGNKWIYVLSKPQLLTISCKNLVIEKEVSNTGILSIKSGCKAYSSRTQLIANNEILIEFQHIIPKVNIIEDICCEDKKTNKTELNLYLEHINLSNIKLEDLNVASHKLDALNDRIDQIHNEPQIVKYGSYVKYGIITVIIVVSIVVLLKIYSCIKPFLPKSLQIRKNCCCKSVIVNQYNALPIRIEGSSEDIDLDSLGRDIEVKPIGNLAIKPTKRRGIATGAAGRLSYDE